MDLTLVTTMLDLSIPTPFSVWSSNMLHIEVPETQSNLTQRAYILFQSQLNTIEVAHVPSLHCVPSSSSTALSSGNSIFL